MDQKSSTNKMNRKSSTDEITRKTSKKRKASSYSFSIGGESNLSDRYDPKKSKVDDVSVSIAELTRSNRAKKRHPYSAKSKGTNVSPIVFVDHPSKSKEGSKYSPIVLHDDPGDSFELPIVLDDPDDAGSQHSPIVINDTHNRIGKDLLKVKESNKLGYELHQKFAKSPKGFCIEEQFPRGV